MRYHHTMIRVRDVDQSLDFYCAKLGLKVVGRTENPSRRFTLIFLAAPDDAPLAAEDRGPVLELKHGWDGEDSCEGRNFGHIAFKVRNLYETCERLVRVGVEIRQPLRNGAKMAFVRSPDNVTIELIQDGKRPSHQEQQCTQE